VGVPFEDIEAGGDNIFSSGAVNVLYGSSSGLSATSPLADQFWTQNTANVNDAAESGDTYGQVLYSGDFNGDGKDDLAFAVPFESVDTPTGNIDRAGAVSVLYGSSSGLSATSPRPDQFWTQGTLNLEDKIEANDGFGGNLI